MEDRKRRYKSNRESLSWSGGSEPDVGSRCGWNAEGSRGDVSTRFWCAFRDSFQMTVIIHQSLIQRAYRYVLLSQSIIHPRRTCCKFCEPHLHPNFELAPYSQISHFQTHDICAYWYKPFRSKAPGFKFVLCVVEVHGNTADPEQFSQKNMVRILWACVTLSRSSRREKISRKCWE